MKSMRRRRCPSRRVRKVVAALNADRIHVSGSSLPSSENNRIVTNNVARFHCFRAAPREMKAPRVHLTAAFAFFLCPYAWDFLMYSFASGVLQPVSPRHMIPTVSSLPAKSSGLLLCDRLIQIQNRARHHRPRRQFRLIDLIIRFRFADAQQFARGLLVFAVTDQLSRQQIS